MKRFFLFVAALCCMGMMSVNALAEKVYVASIGLYFELDEENFSAKIVRDKSGSDNYSHLPSVMPIPHAITYNDKSYIVDVIGANAFASNTTVKEFKLPEDGLLTRIESQAFVESAVEKINIPSTVTEIPYSSFYKSALYNNDANYEDGILYIDGCLIAAKTSLEGEVTVNVGTRLIAGSAFTGCKNINHVTLPEGVTYIGCNAFNNCSALERINFPASLNFIGDNAFLNCKLREVYLKSPLTIGKMAFFATTPSIKTVVLPKGESTFEDYAFSGQPGITRINVYEKDPSQLHMGTGVFDDVDKEKCIVYVPHELNGGSVSDFKATDEWSTFIIQSNNVCADGLFFELNDVTKKMTLTYELYDSYFNYCTLEENVDMVSNIHAIHALDELGYTLTSVGARAFELASQITSITLPETVEHIGMMAFSDLNQMKEFTIPEKVNFIGEFAFSDCTGLEKITNLNPVPQDITGKSVFYNVKKTEVKLMVPPGSRTAYLLADTWGSFDIEELPIRIGDLYYYLNDEDDYAEVTYQYELSEDNYAFLPENTKLVIPSEVTYNEKTYDVRYINSGAFRNCDKIYMVEIPGSVLIVGSSAFNGCKNLWGATLNEGVKSLEMSVFEGCSDLRKVSLPSSMKQIDNYAFKGCTNLMSLLVYNPVPVAISDKVFEDVDKSQMWLCIPYGSKDDYLAAEVWNELGKEDEEHHYIVEMSNGVQVDELYYIFDKVNKTATVTFAYFYAAGNTLGNYYIIDKIPSSVIYEEEEYTVTAIGDYAFWDCYEVNMEIPAGITSIGNYAFANNNNPVTLIVNNETPIDIAGKHVFENSPQDVLFVPAGSAQAYKEAEGWKDFKTIIEKGIKVGELYYHFDKDAKTAMVTYEKYEIYHDNYNSLPEELIIPEKVTYDEVEYTVTEIEQYAFRFSKSLKKVTLPATLEKIANLAFAYCEAMNEMTCYAVEPPTMGEDVFYLVDCPKTPLYVPLAALDKYKSADQWKEFKIEPMETPIVIAGQKITPDMYNTMISGEGIEGDVFVTENGIFLNKGASIYMSDPSVPAIELTATDKVDKFIISGVDAQIFNSIVISGKAEVQFNGALPDGIEHDGPLSLKLGADVWWNTEHTIELTEGAQVKLILNGIESESQDSLTFYSKSEAIHTPVGASCDIHAGGNVDFFIYNENCPVGYNDRTFTLHNTAMVLPYGGSVTEEGVLDAAGEEMFALRLSNNAPFQQSGKAYPIELCGVTVSEGTADDILGDGKASYDAETNTLSLDGMEVYRSEYQALRVVKSSINVEVKGENEFIEHSIRPAIEVENGDLRIFGDKDAKLHIDNYKSVVIRGDRTGKYRVAFEGCNVSVFASSGYTALEADSLYIDAANVSIGSQYDIAWQSMNPNKNGGLVLKHAVLKEGVVNVSPKMLFEPVPQYKVTFQDKDGNEIETQYVFEGEDAVAPEAPAVEGYTFTGWDKEFDNVTSDLTVKAKYEINHYALTLVAGHGTIAITDESGEHSLNPDMIMHGTIVKLIVTADEGYQFTQWSDGNTDNPRTLVLTQDTSLVAHFEIIYLQPDTVTLCYGETYQWHDKTYDASGVYIDTLSSGVATLHLTILPQVEETIGEATICSGDTYTWQADGKEYAESGTYSVTLQDINGCDSVVILHLTVNPIATTEEHVTACDSYTWNGETYTQSGEYVYTTVAANGCDSIVTLHLTLNQSEHVEFSMTACDSYEWHGMTYTISGDYTYTTTTEQGCERVEVLHLTINKSEYVEESVTTCDSYEWHGMTYTISGDYTYTTTTDQGCERVEVLHLTILPDATTESEELALCPSELPYEWYGQWLTEAGSYTATEQYAGMDCDSIIHELTVNVYVQTLPAAVTLPIVRTGEAIDVTIPTAEIQAHIAAETWYAPNAEVAWYIMENSDWAALTAEPVAAGTTQVVLKYAVATDCGNIESDNIVIDVIPTSVENTHSQSPTSDCQKILYEDHIYILREGKMYNAQGQKVQ